MKGQQIFDFARVGLYGGKPLSREQLLAMKKRLNKKATSIYNALKKVEKDK